MSVASPPSLALPLVPTVLVGRERELALICRRFLHPDVRLLTLTGAPGIGKTSLALSVAAELHTTFSDGVWFVDLAPIRDPQLVPSTIAHVLGLSEEVQEPVLSTLIAGLRNRNSLLILDNFEHLLAAASIVSDLLRACSSLRILVTSRERLHLRWEQVFPVPPLQLPDLANAKELTALRRIPAVDLFITRAQAVAPTFDLTPANAEAIAQLCVRLDGLPLALELAAVCVTVLPPAALVQRLDRRLPLLWGVMADLPERHQTLQTAIQWSYDLLTPVEQKLLRRLAIFVGSWTLAAAEAIIDSSSGGAEVLNGIGKLIDHNLVHAVPETDDVPRWSMLETIREYAAQELVTSADYDETVQHYYSYFLALAEEAEKHVRTGQDQAVWLDQIEREHGNFRKILDEGSLIHRNKELGLRLAGALVPFWLTHGYVSEGRRWIELFLAQADIAPLEMRGKALIGAGNMALAQGDSHQAEVLLQAALTVYRELNDPRQLAETLTALGVLARRRGDHQLATQLLDEALTFARQLPDTVSIAQVLSSLSVLAGNQGHRDRQLALLTESLALYRKLHNMQGVAQALNHLALLVLQHGSVDHAKHHLNEALHVYQGLGARRGIALTQANLARIAAHEGQQHKAFEYARESLILFQDLGDMYGVIEALDALVVTLSATGKPQDVARLLGVIEQQRTIYKLPFQPQNHIHFEQTSVQVRTQLPSDIFEAAWAEGRTMTVDQLIEHMPALKAALPHHVQSLGTANNTHSHDKLTARERTVLQLVADGLSNKEIAARLGIASGTVNVHLSSIYSKFQVTSRTAAVRYAQQHSLF